MVFVSERMYVGVCLNVHVLRASERVNQQSVRGGGGERERGGGGKGKEKENEKEHSRERKRAGERKGAAERGSV